MKDKMPKEIVVIYTKQFPYGIRESYLLDEIPILRKEFDEVYFYPYAEFHFDEQQCRLTEDHQIKILRFSRVHQSSGLLAKFSNALKSSTILVREILFSRQRWMALKRAKQNFRRLFHFAGQSNVLNNWLHQQVENKMVHYHYWFHDGLIIAKMSPLASTQDHYARAHSIDLYHKDWPLGGYLPFEKIKYQLVKDVFSVSMHGLKYMQKHFSKFNNKLHYLPLGITQNVIPEIKKADAKILTISFLGNVKNLQRMHDLMMHLKDVFTWVHIGSGPKEVEEAWIEKCSKSGISFDFKGYMTKLEIEEYLKTNQFAFMANTSTWEGVSVSLMEAGIYGIPFIATAIPGNIELVNDENGFIIPLEGDLNEVTNKILACFYDKSTWLQKATSAQKTVVMNYNAEKNHSLFLDHLKTTF